MSVENNSWGHGAAAGNAALADLCRSGVDGCENKYKALRPTRLSSEGSLSITTGYCSYCRKKGKHLVNASAAEGTTYAASKEESGSVLMDPPEDSDEAPRSAKQAAEIEAALKFDPTEYEKFDPDSFVPDPVPPHPEVSPSDEEDYPPTPVRRKEGSDEGPTSADLSFVPQETPAKRRGRGAGRKKKAPTPEALAAEGKLGQPSSTEEGAQSPQSPESSARGASAGPEAASSDSAEAASRPSASKSSPGKDSTAPSSPTSSRRSASAAAASSPSDKGGNSKQSASLPTEQDESANDYSFEKDEAELGAGSAEEAEPLTGSPFPEAPFAASPFTPHPLAAGQQLPADGRFNRIRAKLSPLQPRPVAVEVEHSDSLGLSDFSAPHPRELPSLLSRTGLAIKETLVGGVDVASSFARLATGVPAIALVMVSSAVKNIKPGGTLEDIKESTARVLNYTLKPFRDGRSIPALAAAWTSGATACASAGVLVSQPLATAAIVVGVAATGGWVVWRGAHAFVTGSRLRGEKKDWANYWRDASKVPEGQVKTFDEAFTRAVADAYSELGFKVLLASSLASLKTQNALANAGSRSASLPSTVPAGSKKKVSGKMPAEPDRAAAARAGKVPQKAELTPPQTDPVVSLFIKDAENNISVVSCKRCNGQVGIREIRNILDMSRFHYKGAQPVVVTTVGFTSVATDYAKKYGVLLMTINPLMERASRSVI